MFEPFEKLPKGFNMLAQCLERFGQLQNTATLRNWTQSEAEQSADLPVSWQNHPGAYAHKLQHFSSLNSAASLKV